MTPAEMSALHALCFTTPPPWPEAAFADMLSHPLTFALTEAEGLLIGRAVAGEAELLTLAVAPQARRRGVGARLVQRFLYQACLRGAEEAFLEVAAPNLPARTLYSRAGFAEAGIRRDYYHQPGAHAIDAVVMRRALGPVPAAQAG
jgi:[ribosomal protein S18]-alanine N-acetyltransferase